MLLATPALNSIHPILLPRGAWRERTPPSSVVALSVALSSACASFCGRAVAKKEPQEKDAAAGGSKDFMGTKVASARRSQKGGRGECAGISRLPIAAWRKKLTRVRDRRGVEEERVGYDEADPHVRRECTVLCVWPIVRAPKSPSSPGSC